MAEMAEIANVVLDPRDGSVRLVLHVGQARVELTIAGAGGYNGDVLKLELQKTIGYPVELRDDAILLKGVVIATRNSPVVIRLLDWWVCQNCSWVTASSAERCAGCACHSMDRRGHLREAATPTPARIDPAVAHRAVLACLNSALAVDPGSINHLLNIHWMGANEALLAHQHITPDSLGGISGLSVLNAVLDAAGLPVVAGLVDRSGEITGFCSYTPTQETA